jgi:serine/threonine-protein kinase
MPANAATRRAPFMSGARLRRLFGWSKPEESKRRVPGPRGDYELERLIERGDTGEIHEASHPRLAGRLAIKLVHVASGASAETMEAFRRDVALVAGARHPHCLQVLEIGATADGVPFLVMELLEGETLAQLLDRYRTLGATEAIELIKAIAHGLTAAHDQNVIHGNLRPEKVFLASTRGYKRGFVKLMGFGFGRLSFTPTADGSPLAVGEKAAPFAAPELGTAAFDTLDGRTDEFALAAIAYRMLAGTNAFAGEDAVTVRRRMRGEAPRPLPDAARFGRGVDGVLRRGLAKAAHQRFSTVAAFVQALEDALVSSAPLAVSEVTSGQIVMASPITPAGANPQVELGDDISQGFFEEGKRLEATGAFHENDAVRVRSLDKIARHRGPWSLALGLVLLLLAGAGPVAWWAGWRPPQSWQQSWPWRALHLPSSEPARPR